MGDMRKKRTGKDRIWELWERGRGRGGGYGEGTGRTEHGRFGDEENRGGQQNLGYMGKKRTGEDKIWEMWGRR